MSKNLTPRLEGQQQQVGKSGSRGQQLKQQVGWGGGGEVSSAVLAPEALLLGTSLCVSKGERDL